MRFLVTVLTNGRQWDFAVDLNYSWPFLWFERLDPHVCPEED